MIIPQEVREAAGRLEKVVFNEEDPVAVYEKHFKPDKREDNPWGRRQIAGRLLEEDFEELGRYFLGLIQSGAIPSQEVIDAIRILADDADYDDRESIGRAADTLHEWLDKLEQKEESGE